MSKTVNTSVCPFHGYVPKHWPLRPHRCGIDHSELMLQPGSPPASLHSKGHGGHKIRYLRGTCRIPEAGRAHANATPGEMQHICETSLRSHSVSSLCCLEALKKIHFRLYLKPVGFFWSFITHCRPVRFWCPALVHESYWNAVLPCSGNNKNKFFLSAHLWKIKCRLTADLQRRGTRQVRT